MHALATFWVNLPLRRKGLIVLALPLAALVIGSTISLVQARRQAEAADETRRTMEIRSELQQVLTRLVDAETGVRGYLLTGDPTFLEPYTRSQATVPATLRRLGTLVRDEEIRVSLDTELVPLAAERLAVLEPLKQLGDSSGVFPATIPVDQFLASKAVMDQVRSVITAMIDRESHLLAQRAAREEQAGRRAQAATLGTLLVGLVGGLLGTALFTTGVVRRVDELALHAEELAEGRPVELRARANDKVGDLGRSLETASALLRMREEQLRRWGQAS